MPHMCSICTFSVTQNQKLSNLENSKYGDLKISTIMCTFLESQSADEMNELLSNFLLWAWTPRCHRATVCMNSNQVSQRIHFYRYALNTDRIIMIVDLLLHCSYCVECYVAYPRIRFEVRALYWIVAHALALLFVPIMLSQAGHVCFLIIVVYLFLHTYPPENHSWINQLLVCVG